MCYTSTAHSLKGRFSVLAGPLDHVITIAEHRICFFMALVSCFHVLRCLHCRSLQSSEKYFAWVHCDVFTDTFRAAFLIPMCFCRPNCCLVRTGRLLQGRGTAALLGEARSWLLNQTRAEAAQPCAELPLEKPLSLKFTSPLWHSAKKEPNLGKEAVQVEEGLFSSY